MSAPDQPDEPDEPDEPDGRPAAPAFFVRTDDALVPGPHARGPWSADMLHGRLLAGLAAGAIEDEHGDDGFQFVRLTVDLFRSPPVAPLQIKTSLVRAGRRVRAADAVITSGAHQVARASALMLRRGRQPEDRVWRPPDWSVPGPDELAPVGPAPPGTAGFEVRPITPGWFTSFDQRRMWFRDRAELIAGEPMSPFVRLAAAADFANPVANFGENGLDFINADLSLSLYRLPESDWIGFESAGHLSGEGVAVGQCTLYDIEGAVGYCTVCAVATEGLQRTSR